MAGILAYPEEILASRNLHRLNSRIYLWIRRTKLTFQVHKYRNLARGK
jgi:hypothetical protein